MHCEEEEAAMGNLGGKKDGNCMGAQEDVLVKGGIFQTAEHVCESLQETSQKNWHLYRFPLTHRFFMFPLWLSW